MGILTVVQHSLLEQYQEYLALYLQYRETDLASQTQRELLAALCSGRGALNFSGMFDPIGETEQTAVSLLTPQELHTVLQGIQVELLTSRLTNFVRLSEENGGDVSLVEPEEDQEALVEAGQNLLWERHDIACQLEGIRWWLQHREDLRAAMEPALTACHHSLAQLDALWQDNIAHFLPLNTYRRFYRDAYPQAQDFWWWHHLADCDRGAVYQVAEGEAEPSLHLQDCSHCQHLLGELRAAKSLLRAARGRPLSHPQPEDLVRLFEGEIGGQEETALEVHLRLCETCRWEFEALQRGDEDEGVGVPSGEDEGKGYVVFFVFPLPQEAAVEGGTDKVQGLPGQVMYQDDEIEVWVNAEGDRVIVRVYGSDLQGLGSLNVIEYDTLEARPVVTIARQPTEVVWDLGNTQELRGKSLLLSLRLNEREIELPRFDLIEGETP
jgi:hypothetical protein